jgi:Dyp-type peroxidase family
MFTLKYKVTNVPSDPSHHFDLSAFRRRGRIHNITSWIFDRGMLAVFWLLREIWPNPQFWRFVLVTRAADVKQVLEDSEHFAVPFGPEMTALAGANSVLGLDGIDHTYQNEIIQRVLRPGDLENILIGTRTLTRNLIMNSAGRIDAVRDLITRVSTETCSDYFGLIIEDPEAFAEWSIAMSMLLFADPFGDEKTRQVGLAGAARMRKVIHRAIGRARNHPDDATLVGRLVFLQKEQAKSGQPRILTDGEICGILMSLVTGFVPTNTLAAGKILQELLRRPRQMSKAKDSARRGDKERLKRILLEAARFNAALSPGQWRLATKPQTIAAGHWRRKNVKAGSVLMVATRSALRDRRAVADPARFIENRHIAPNLMFGFGPHQCLGKHIAIAHIVEIFAILLSQENLRRCAGADGQFEWIGPFPERLDMEFEGAASTSVQSMITVCAPLAGGFAKEKVKELIGSLETAEPEPPAGAPRDPRKESITQALKKTGIVHFASLSVIDAGDAKQSQPYLVFELNVDGTKEAAIDAVARCAGTQLKPIFDCTPLGGSQLVATLNAYALELKTRPWGATGLNFNGTPEFPVADIARQQRLAEFAKDALGYFVELHSGIGSRAMPAVEFVRKFIHQNERFVRAANASDNEDRERVEGLLKRGAEFQDYLSLPGRKRLLTSDWVERSPEDALYHFLKSWDFWRPVSPLMLVAIFMSAGIFYDMGATGWLGLPGQLLIALTGGIVSTALFVIFTLAAFFLLLRAHERADVPDDQDPKLSEIRAVAACENLPRHAQNHFMAVTPLKNGWFRKLTLAGSLWGIKQLVRHAYRPGFVLNMGTIHYAKWFRLPKTDKLIFLSNYDGSWESYLEDFIMKAHPGQTAAWSNGVGFPKTNYLIYDGAKDGDRFKRWVRRQQVPTQFWYSRFSDLTTDQIRTNAIIHDGLARANTDSSARNWLDCFGSMQRPDYAIETEEIQSLVFRGFIRSDYVGYALIDFSNAKVADWLQCLLPAASANAHGDSHQPEYKVSKLTFGDRPYNEDPTMRDKATFVAFSAAGLKKLGIPLGDDEDGLSTFASPFNIGMVNRRRILGDLPERSPKWRWSDADPVSDDGTSPDEIPTAHAILMVYCHSPERCDEDLAAHEALLGGNAFIATIKAQPVEKKGAIPEKRGVPREHFGFRDGISQPVIRGTQRFTEGALEGDTVEPGEFILGYKNNQGYYPPAARVSAESDMENRLPDVLASSPSKFPSFGTNRSAARDFGRNGSFLVVRQIEQHVDEFDTFTRKAKDELARKYTNLSSMVGADISEDWVAAKMMGRWKESGEALVVRSGADRGEKPKKLSQTENDFSFAIDDPQGLYCPFGAHIRRANPRDGLQPDDAMQQAITNRHRLLRRGRAYELSAEEAMQQGDSKPEKGLVFTCLCADLERQFEFVQQTWIGSSSFHGLGGEVDPIVGWKDPTSVFTIPTPSGPITLDCPANFVTVRAGGYFFLPSRSAVYYLLDLCRTKSAPGQTAEGPAVAQAPNSSFAGEGALLTEQKVMAIRS